MAAVEWLFGANGFRGAAGGRTAREASEPTFATLSDTAGARWRAAKVPTTALDGSATERCEGLQALDGTMPLAGREAGSAVVFVVLGQSR